MVAITNNYYLSIDTQIFIMFQVCPGHDSKYCVMEMNKTKKSPILMVSIAWRRETDSKKKILKIYNINLSHD